MAAGTISSNLVRLSFPNDGRRQRNSSMFPHHSDEKILLEPQKHGSDTCSVFRKCQTALEILFFTMQPSVGRSNCIRDWKWAPHGWIRLPWKYRKKVAVHVSSLGGNLYIPEPLLCVRKHTLKNFGHIQPQASTCDIDIYCSFIMILSTYCDFRDINSF